MMIIGNQVYSHAKLFLAEHVRYPKSRIEIPYLYAVQFPIYSLPDSFFQVTSLRK